MEKVLYKGPVYFDVSILVDYNEDPDEMRYKAEEAILYFMLPNIRKQFEQQGYTVNLCATHLKPVKDFRR